MAFTHYQSYCHKPLSSPKNGKADDYKNWSYFTRFYTTAKAENYVWFSCARYPSLFSTKNRMALCSSQKIVVSFYSSFFQSNHICTQWVSGTTEWVVIKFTWTPPPFLVYKTLIPRSASLTAYCLVHCDKLHKIILQPKPLSENPKGKKARWTTQTAFAFANSDTALQASGAFSFVLNDKIIIHDSSFSNWAVGTH